MNSRNNKNNGNNQVIQDMELVKNSTSASPMTTEEDVYEERLAGGSIGGHSHRTNGSEGESSSSSEGNSSSNESGRSGSTGDKTDHLFSRKGLMALAGARCCFFFILLVAASVMAAIVFISLSDNQTEDFNSEFDGIAFALIKGSHENVNKVFFALESLSLTSTTFIEQQKNDTYPDGFVTFPNVERHLGSARQAANAMVLGYAPHIQGQEQYDLWLQYVQENIDWVEEAYNVNPSEPPQISPNPEYDEEFFLTRIWKNRISLNGVPFVVDNESFLQCPARAEPDIGLTYTYEVANPSSGMPLSPVWMTSPPPNPTSDLIPINFNIMSNPSFLFASETIAATERPTFEDVCENPTNLFHPNSLAQTDLSELYTLLAVPAWNEYGDSRTIVGYFFAIVPWSFYLSDILNGYKANPVVAVLRNKCSGKAFSYQVIGGEAILLDPAEDVHQKDLEYEAMAYAEPFAEEFVKNTNETGGDENSNSCISNDFTITIYPTQQFESTYRGNEPVLYTIAVLAIFLFTALAFMVFDWISQRNQRGIMDTAIRQNALVSSLFPKNIQKKLMEEIKEESTKNNSGKAGLRNYLNNEEGEEEQQEGVGKTKPIADLFPETTIMFADIAGFTAWSSTREPSQVFTLLEALYHEFDKIAKRRRVFKVEVVGDCYVAVCGLPDPRKDHGVVMAKFANDCMHKMTEVTNKLVVELGPDTNELGLRVGLHSGTVVAGVLRGDKSRFQLFGDTMNTASRMESTGKKGCIQLSQQTTDILLQAGKKNWIVPREDKVEAKGKGEMQTYFLNIQSRDDRSDTGTSASESSVGDLFGDGNKDDATTLRDIEKRSRSAQWVVEILANLLKEIVAKRESLGIRKDPVALMEKLETMAKGNENTMVIDEVKEIITLPGFVKKQKSKVEDTADLGDAVLEELKDYVIMAASLYNDNPFHCFDHAVHVSMSCTKLLARIATPDLDQYTAQEVFDHTYGITSDPLTQFATVFAALIHDIDHKGVPNSQLVNEGAPIADYYHNKSVAEQNSVDIAWELLMEDSYKNLRRTIYTTVPEFKRFRELVVNAVMATDIVDKDLKTLRNKRWEVAFDPNTHEDAEAARNRKATIVIEHLIQASDVAHTMQHWYIYRKWNEKFFRECYQAYLDGRADKNPAEGWYQGELGFFDFYIIPLAKKLKECGVFGVSSDEYLSYAVENRKEWEKRGEMVVEEMKSQVESKMTPKRRSMEKP